MSRFPRVGSATPAVGGAAGGPCRRPGRRGPGGSRAAAMDDAAARSGGRCLPHDGLPGRARPTHHDRDVRSARGGARAAPRGFPGRSASTCPSATRRGPGPRGDGGAARGTLRGTGPAGDGRRAVPALPVRRAGRPRGRRPGRPGPPPPRGEDRDPERRRACRSVERQAPVPRAGAREPARGPERLPVRDARPHGRLDRRMPQGAEAPRGVDPLARAGRWCRIRGRWRGGVPATPGVTATVLLLDPIERPRAAPWVGLDGLHVARPRHAGYADLLGALRPVGRA